VDLSSHNTNPAGRIRRLEIIPTHSQTLISKGIWCLTVPNRVGAVSSSVLVASLGAA
jgi:hypothetical protein